MEITSIGQYAIIITDRKLLLLKRPSEHWCLPGGRIGKNVEPYSEFKREIYEELSTNVLSCKPIDVGIFKDDYQIKYIVLFLTEIQIDQIQLSQEHTEYRFFTKSEINQLESIDGYVGLKEKILQLF